MYLPAGDALLQEREGGVTPVTFQEYRESTYKAFKEGQGHLASAAGRERSIVKSINVREGLSFNCTLIHGVQQSLKQKAALESTSCQMSD
jgi:hypothetical protein